MDFGIIKAVCKEGGMAMYKYSDYYGTYGRIMQFNKNKTEPFHRWYPFVEGYSKEFIQSILKEMDMKSLVCLEPFSGSGTTALELQNSGVKCYSFEVNPLMYLIARVKLEKDYSSEELMRWFQYVCNERKNLVVTEVTSEFKTLYQNDSLKKWNYNYNVAIAVKKLELAIESISDEKYKELLKVALASILLDVSNLYRNGKCLSYKKEWKERKITEDEVYAKFDKKITSELLVDIERYLTKSAINNKQILFNMDSREGIAKFIEDESIDLVITSPPYLNSRDYTDTYMLELKTLDFAKDNEDIRKLRERTLRSHVQIKWDDCTTIENELLQKTLHKLEIASKDTDMWNNSIIDMVRLYFVDLQGIFQTIYSKLKPGGRIYFNVSNSAYFNILINTLEICASIAENIGYKVIEIRKARNLKTSPQQKEKIGSLLEGVIILEK